MLVPSLFLNVCSSSSSSLIQKGKLKQDLAQSCGCPTSDFKSGYCERLKKDCAKHVNWENIGRMEMDQEQKRQTQLLSSLTHEIHQVKSRIKRRNLSKDEEHLTVEENT